MLFPKKGPGPRPKPWTGGSLYLRPHQVYGRCQTPQPPAAAALRQRQHLPSGHRLVRRRHHPGLLVPGEGKAQGEHVQGNGLPLALVQIEPEGRPLGGNGPVDEGVHPADALQPMETADIPPIGPAMPVIAKKVVEQCRPGHPAHILPGEAQSPGHTKGQLRCGHRVVIY